MKDRLHLILGTLATAVLVTAAVIWNDRLHTDFWPPDRSTIGPNLLASLIWIVPSFVAGFAAGRHAWRKHRDHQEWQAKHTAEMYHEIMGRPPEAHPHFEGVK